MIGSGMVLAKGARLGPYEVQAPLGAGGMGEVYLATDTRLGRQVAIKILPPELSASDERRERFEREAKVIASLAHPHICALYDVGSHEGTTFLVMEYLQGETLGARLKRPLSGSREGGQGAPTAMPEGGKRPLPMNDALRFGAQIADALAHAHQHGVVHRDLKPANVILTPGGVKLLDFGLARIEASAPRPPDARRSEAPTHPHSLTGDGNLLGTLEYMAPEQLEGRAADARTDIFALAAVVYEMLTGRRPFVARSEGALIAAILHDEPTPLGALLPSAPEALERLLADCLAKRPEERWQSAADVRRELARLAAAGASVTSGTRKSPGRRMPRLRAPGVAAIALASAAAGFVAKSVVTRPAPSLGAETAYHVELSLRSLPEYPDLAMSRDGSMLAYVGFDDARTLQLWVRAMSADGSRVLPGAEWARGPFWSPDGHALAFTAHGSLRAVSLAGGAPRIVCEARGIFLGGAWSRDGQIVFALSPGGLFVVPAAGGEPRPLLGPASADKHQGSPQFLPDDRHVLFADLGGPSGAQPGIYVTTIDGREPPRRVLDVATSFALSEPDGHLLYARGDRLFAQKFDLGLVAPVAAPIVVGDDAESAEGLRPPGFAVSDTSVLVYRRIFVPSEELVWFDLTGKRVGTLGPPGRYHNFSLSPDGTRVLASRPQRNPRRHAIWLTDSVRGSSDLVVPEDERPMLSDPVWAADGRSFYWVEHGDPPVVKRRTIDASAEQIVYESRDGQPYLESVSRDGRWLALAVSSPKGGQVGAIVDLSSTPPKTWALDGVDVDELALSPDGRWVAYNARVGQRFDVVVNSVPPTARSWRVSTGGGVQPQWADGGHAIVFLDPDGAIERVAVGRGPGELQPGVPKLLFRTGLSPAPNVNQYALAPEGDRVLVVQSLDPPEHRADVVIRWPLAVR